MAIRQICKDVNWKERDGEHFFKGEVVKEVQEIESYEWGDFCRVIQIIRKEGESEDLIRFGYYVKDQGSPDKDYVWGSRSTFISKISTFDKLMEKAKKEGLI